MAWPRHLFVVLSALVLAGCGGCGSSDGNESQAPGAGPTAHGAALALSLIDALPSCDVSYRGLLLDLGSPAMRGRYRNRLTSPEGIVEVEHKGASWARVYDRVVELRFLLPEPSPVFVSLRGVGREASRVSISLDGYLLGTLKLGREPKVHTTQETSLPVDSGMHTLRLRFSGRTRPDGDPFAEIDWVRIGMPDELPRTYGAPTLEDVLSSSAQIGGVPHRAIALHAPGSVRCGLSVPPKARLTASIGMRGAGSASAAIVVLQDDADPVVVERVDVAGGEDAAWSEVDVSLDAFAGRVVTVELMATKTAGTGRLLFGDPVITVPSVPAISTARTPTAVVVALSGIERRDLPPWRNTETPHLPTLNQLAKTFTVFDNHRAPSTLVAASIASLVTGLPPSEHGLVDGGASLSPAVQTLARIAGNASVRAAMFTGVPTTFGFFGFEPHWDRFQSYPPNGGRLATAPIDDAAAWLSETLAPNESRPMLAFVHGRGGHPPWDVTPTEAAKLPPAEYPGGLSPRRAAQVLASLEGRHSRLGEADRERMRALYFVAMSGQDMALGKLIQGLEDAGRWESTLMIVTGDVASGRQSLFGDGLAMDEDLLTLPLYVHFPGGRHGGERVDAPTEMYDITRTVMAALDLKPTPAMLGQDLAEVAAGVVRGERQLRVAFTEQTYSARWGEFALVGELQGRPRLCRLSLDPTCAYDHTSLYPLTAQALLRKLAWFSQRPGAPPVPERQPLTLDAEMQAMLKVWGIE